MRLSTAGILRVARAGEEEPQVAADRDAIQLVIESSRELPQQGEVEDSIT